MLDGLRGRDRDEQGARVGVADVLAGRDDDSPRKEARVLASFEHGREVVDGSVRVTAAHGLDERGREVVVAIPGAVVAERPLSGRVADVVERRAR